MESRLGTSFESRIARDKRTDEDRVSMKCWRRQEASWVKENRRSYEGIRKVFEDKQQDFGSKINKWGLKGLLRTSRAKHWKTKQNKNSIMRKLSSQ